MKHLLSLLLCLIAGSSYAQEPYNLDKMRYSTCFAGSRPDKKALGGYGTSTNAPRKSDSSLGTPGSISLVATPSTPITVGDNHRGFPLYLINRTNTEASFSAADSRLPIICEAKDANSAWRPIEALPEIWCGNSYHQVFLPKNHCWKFIVPEYTGSLHTRLRYVLQSKPPIYSNEFDGHINPGQLKNPPRD